MDAQEGHFGMFAQRQAKGKGKGDIWQEGDDRDVDADAYMGDCGNERNPRDKIGSDQYEIWGKNMHNMRQVLGKRTGSNMQNCRLQSFWAEYELHAGQIVCRDIPCIKQEHDIKWKYRQKRFDFNINLDGESRDLLAEIIVHKKTGSPFVDTISLGKANIKQRHLDMSNRSNIGVDTRVNCDLNNLGGRPNTTIQADKKWKYRKRVDKHGPEHWYKTRTNQRTSVT
eukprot:16445682-Heterocapsa_arctica.AAC.1